MRYLLPLLLLFPTPALAADLLLVGNKGEHTVSFIDLETGAELARPATSATAPHEIAISPDGSRAAVVNYGDKVIDIFDVATREIVDTIDLGANTRPHGIAWHDTGHIFATTEGGRSLVQIGPELIARPTDRGTDSHKFTGKWTVRSIPTDADGTHMLAVNGEGTTAYTANLGDRTVSRIDLISGEVTHMVTAGEEPEGIALTPDGTELWVSARGSDQVVVLDATSMETLATIAVGRFPLRLLISPDGRHAVTSNLQDASVSVIDVANRKLVRTIAVGEDASTQQVTLLFSEDGSRLYVAETGTDTVAEVDFASGEVLRRIPVGRQGDGLAIVSE